jgi:EmrB/QacA subfamily drug resistance transporter
VAVRGVGAASRPAAGGWGLPLFTLILGTFMAMLDSTIVNVAIPTMIGRFGSSPDQVQWVITAFLLVLGVVVPVTGWLGDRFGLTRMYVVSLVIFTLGSALCGLSPSLSVLVLFRVVQGVGGGLMAPLTMAMVYRLVPRERIGTAMGIYGITYAAAPAIGPTLGGYLVEFVNWRSIFFVNVPIGVITVALALAVLPPFPTGRPRPLDRLGFAASGAGLGLLLLAISEGQVWGWRSEAVVLLIMAGLWLLALFVLVELQVDNPLLDLRLFSYRVFALSIGVVVIASVTLYAANFFVPLFMQSIQGRGAYPTGLTLLPAGLFMAVCMPLAGRVYDAVGARWPVLAGMVGVATAMWLLTRLQYPTPDGSIVLWMVVLNAALGVAWMPAATAGLSVVPTSEITRASAINNIAGRVAGALSLAALTSMFTAGVAQRSSDLAAHVTQFNHQLLAITRETAGTYGQSMQLSSPQAAPAAGVLLAGHLVAVRAFAGAVHQVFADTAILGLIGAGLAVFLKEHRRAAPRAPAPEGPAAPPSQSSA